MFDLHGDVQPVGLGQQGLFDHGTRYLSRLNVRIGDGTRPLLLGSTVDRDSAVLIATVTNPDLQRDGHVVVARNTVHVERATVVIDGLCWVRLAFRSYDQAPIELPVAIECEADFADVFEVRGVKRAARGTLETPRAEDGRLVFTYRGLDDVVRRTVVAAEPPPARVEGTRFEWIVPLEAEGYRNVDVVVQCRGEDRTERPPTFHDAARIARDALREASSGAATVRTSNGPFNDWMRRSAADLAMMITQTPQGPIPYGGVPWFCTPFGRDALFTAYEVLWAHPALARGVLRFLAATQATGRDAVSEAEPGRIVHEMRAGEMAALGEIPFARYYGSADATPLFVVLAEAYHARTGDLALVRELWPHVQRALDWIDGDGDPDRDGFVEYARQGRDGLRNQGWKDSEDSIFHADGALAEGPIALCEVQAYVYAAKRGAARLAAALDEPDHARALETQAMALRERFERTFWCDDLGSYALALDGAKRACRVRTSNAGHCLFAGIASPAHAHAVAATLTGPEMYSGWGVRTVARGERRYNPMSYHNGSVWPHDNAIVADGMARYGIREGAQKILEGMFDVCRWTDLQRLPELFCGFPRTPGTGPTLYPVACSPQAWAAASVYLLLSACIGLSIDAHEQRVRLTHPRLPPFLDTLSIEGLRVGDAMVDLELHRHQSDVGVDVPRRYGTVEVLLVK